MSITIHDSEFFSKYKPIKNPFDKNSSSNGTMFETFGEELAEVIRVHDKEPNKIWTLVDADRWTVVNGLCYVNRLGYFICEVPFEEGQQIEVIDPDEEDSDDHDF